MYDSFYWTYVVRGVSCRAVSVCTIFLYRVVLLRGSFRIVVPSLAMGYGGSLAGNTKMRKAILIRVHCKKLCYPHSQNYSNQGVCFDKIRGCVLIFCYFLLFCSNNPVSATHRQPRSPTRRILVAPLTHISLFKLHTSIKIKSYCAHLLTCSG